MKDSFDPHNPRVKKARQKHLLNTPPFLALLLLLFIALLTGGIALLYFKHSIGWTLIGFSVLPAMLIFWIKTALTDIPIKKTDNFTDILSENLLLLLSSSTSATDFAQILPKTPSGAFIMARFGLPVPFFTNISNLLPSTTEPIYQTARTIREATQSEEITGAVLAVAIIATIPNHETLLNQLQLTMDDLHQGIIWFNYLRTLRKQDFSVYRQNEYTLYTTEAWLELGSFRFLRSVGLKQKLVSLLYRMHLFFFAMAMKEHLTGR